MNLDFRNPLHPAKPVLDYLETLFALQPYPATPSWPSQQRRYAAWPTWYVSWNARNATDPLTFPSKLGSFPGGGADNTASDACSKAGTVAAETSCHADTISSADGYSEASTTLAPRPNSVNHGLVQVVPRTPSNVLRQYTRCPTIHSRWFDDSPGCFNHSSGVSP